MLRWSGVLSLVAAAVLLGILLKKTRTLELVGNIPGVPSDTDRSADPLPPGRRVMLIRLSDAGEPTDGELSHLWAAGVSASLSSLKVGDGPQFWTWELEVPEEVVQTTTTGDAVALCARLL